MQNTKHTPGPWNYAHGSTDLLTHDGDDVAYVDTAIPERSRAEQRANARLIASAPDLAAIAEKLVYLWDAGIRPQVVKGMLREEQEFAQLIDAARAAIAKATNL